MCRLMQPGKFFVQFKYLSVVLSLKLFELYLLQGKRWPDDLSAVVSYESCVIMSDGSCLQGQPKYVWNNGQINHNTQLQRRPLFADCLLRQSDMQGYEVMCIVFFFWFSFRKANKNMLFITSHNEQVQFCDFTGYIWLFLDLPKLIINMSLHHDFKTVGQL